MILVIKLESLDSLLDSFKLRFKFVARNVPVLYSAKSQLYRRVIVSKFVINAKLLIMFNE